MAARPRLEFLKHAPRQPYLFARAEFRQHLIVDRSSSVAFRREGHEGVDKIVLVELIRLVASVMHRNREQLRGMSLSDRRRKKLPHRYMIVRNRSGERFATKIA